MGSVKPRLILEIKRKDTGVVYKQPNCRIKTMGDGSVQCLIRTPKGKWQSVKGEATIKGHRLEKRFYYKDRGIKRLLPIWVNKYLRLLNFFN